MTQPKYLVKDRKPGRPPAQTTAPVVFYPEIRKEVSHGIFVHSEGTGKFRKDVVGIEAETKNGCSTAAFQQVPATAEGVKKAIRSLREQEAAKLDAVDAEIATLRAQLEVKQEDRRALLKEAWTKAHVVTLKELLPLVRLGRFGKVKEDAAAN